MMPEAILVAKMTPEEKEAYHREAEARFRTLEYQRPQSDKVKDVAWLMQTDKIVVAVQVVKDGGENNLHYHVNADQVYFVLKGRMRFYGVGDVLLGEAGPNQGVFMPAGSRYWFEKVGTEDLEVLQQVFKSGKSERVNIDAHKAWMEDDMLKVYEAPPPGSNR
jgi:mannose-6-phosphate isomerase-like protein (cupin superfamily)